MASKVIVHSQHLQETSGVWKTTVSKAPRKGVVGGRTPLGDLSNSIKPHLNQASKKPNSTIFSDVEKEISASQNSLNATKKKNASGKVQTSGRKALSDISNSGKPNLNEGSKKKHSVKLSVVEEKPIDVDTIAEEQILHNHEECIKVQARAMDLSQVLQTLGLDKDFPKQQASPMFIKSPPRCFEFKEMPEELITEDQTWKHRLDSPRSPKYFLDYDCNLKLSESPVLPKHIDWSLVNGQ